MERRTGLWVAGIAAAVLVMALALVIPWQWLPGDQLPRISAGELFSSHELRHASDYYLLQRTLGLTSLALSLVLAVALGCTCLGARLMSRLPGPWWLKTVLGCLVLSLISTVVVLPLTWWMHMRAERFGLAAGGSAQWFSDLGLGLVTSWLFTAVPMLALLWLMRRLPRRWPLAAAVGGALLSIGFGFAYPVAVEPIFNKFSSLDDPGLRSQIMELARAEHVDVSDVLVADASRRTTTLNAYVSGFGSTRRVVLYDTLLKDTPRPEVLAVVAHELSHARHNDAFVGTALGAVAVALAMGLLPMLLGPRLRRRAGLAEVPDATWVPALLALAAIGTLLVAPVQNAASRAVEARADRDALITTKDPAGFEAMQLRLSRAALSDPDPPTILSWWFGTHPTTVQRIGMARSQRV